MKTFGSRFSKWLGLLTAAVSLVAGFLGIWAALRPEGTSALAPQQNNVPGPSQPLARPNSTSDVGRGTYESPCILAYYELATASQEDEELAKAKFEGKTLEVTGNIDRVGLTHLSMELRGHSTNFWFPDARLMRNAKVGETVTVKGEVLGISRLRSTLNHCELKLR